MRKPVKTSGHHLKGEPAEKYRLMAQKVADVLTVYENLDQGAYTDSPDVPGALSMLLGCVEILGYPLAWEDQKAMTTEGTFEMLMDALQPDATTQTLVHCLRAICARTEEEGREAVTEAMRWLSRATDPSYQDLQLSFFAEGAAQ